MVGGVESDFPQELPDKACIGMAVEAILTQVLGKKELGDFALAGGAEEGRMGGSVEAGRVVGEEPRSHFRSLGPRVMVFFCFWWAEVAYVLVVVPGTKECGWKLDNELIILCVDSF